jgi:hypothetical protein
MDQVQEPGNTHLGYLVNRTLALMSRHWKRYFALVGLPLFVTLLLFVILGVVGLLMRYVLVPAGVSWIGIGMIMVSLVLIPAIALSFSWATLALTYSVAFGAGGRESLAKTKGQILSWWWISFIAVFALYGGTIFLVVPGIMLWFRFLLAEQALVIDKVKGLQALFVSRSMAAGNYMLLLGASILAGLPAFVLSGLSESYDVTESASTLMVIIGLLAIPLYLLAGVWSTVLMAVFYVNLKQRKGEVAMEPTKGFKISTTLWAIVGILVIPLIITSFYWRYRTQSARIDAIEKQKAAEEQLREMTDSSDYESVYDEYEYEYDYDYQNENEPFDLEDEVLNFD